ncbi:hypothetical protein DFH11DRAFT_1725850 [Phellopilus nigrolimitatus]|nr:hypothetical protein DFH11DRAFT_1725850 [Phellopilus nigrolimitatus]
MICSPGSHFVLVTASRSAYGAELIMHQGMSRPATVTRFVHLLQAAAASGDADTIEMTRASIISDMQYAHGRRFT